MLKMKRDSWQMKLLVILGIIILPLIYSLFYLKAFWDPYHELNRVPVALVNLDKCEKDCKGDELVDTLKKKDIFDFKEVSKKDADAGLIDKNYYAILEIPEDFTSTLENAENSDREPATIVFKPNSKSSYLATEIITSAVKQIESQLQSNVNKEIVLKLTDNLQSVPKQTMQIGDALGTIHEGTNKLYNGAFELNQGMNKLNTNYRLFNNGVEKLSIGANTLYNSYADLNNGIVTASNGANVLKEKTDNLDTLIGKVNELKKGSDTYTAGLKEYQTKTNEMISNTTKAYEALKAYCNGNVECQTNPYLKGAYEVALGYTTADASGYNGMQQLQGGLNNLVNSNAVIKGGIDQLANGLSTLKTGSSKVYSGIDEIKNGLSSLNTNSDLINSGINTASNGTKTLTNGTNTLNNGVGEAQTKIDDKVSEVSKQTDQLTGLDNYAEDPIKIEEDNYGNVHDYGTFFAPYFMSLSLWVGGILVLMGLYYDPDQRFKVLGRNSENRGKRLLYYNIISIVQAVILAFLLKLLLGFEVTNILLYYGSCILISGAFLAAVMFLFFTFKDIGKFLAIVLLVTQLAACNGTFPIQTEPGIYQAIFPYMPMTYSVELLRESLVSINSSLLIKDVTYLIAIFVGFNALTFIVSIIKSKREKRKQGFNTKNKIAK